MSKANIQGSEYPVLEVFSNHFIFTIPNFQRPYAWTTEHAGELLEDLITFLGDNNDDIDALTPYFLGSIVLIKGDKPDAQVVDGQQRLTSLTILLSVLRSMMPKDAFEGLTTIFYQEGIKMAGIPTSYRLTLHQRDTPFFREYIQHEGGIEKLKQLNKVLSESQKNIRDNALLFVKRLEELSEEQRIRLATFIITRCFLVVVSTPDLDSAYRIFSVLNDRGLDLSYTDILKAEIIGKIPAQKQDEYTSKWEDIENYLGREGFQNIFAYIRTIYRKAKTKDTILKEFRAYVRPAEQPEQFIDDVLTPYGEAYHTIKHAAYLSTTDASQLNGLFKWLNRIDNADWFPPAIAYLSKNQQQPDLLLRFFTELERLAAGLMIIRANVNKRIERYSRLLTAIEQGDDVFSPTSPLQLTDEECRDILIALDGNMYENWSCRYVLLRLNEEVSERVATFDDTVISIEHVLPQHPKADSTWMTWFPDEDKRKLYVHQIGNLVLLSRKKNGEAQNFDFGKKKQRYFTWNGVTSFALTTQVLLHQEWTPAVIEERQQRLVQKLKAIWRL